MNIIAISGSMRQQSTNTALLENLCKLAPDGMQIDVFRGIGELPIFSPDLEGENTPNAVLQFIDKINQADGVIVASPEYIHAIPGGLKNAIDWLVSGEAIINKPIVIAHASHRGEDMLASLRLVLGTVSAGFNADIFLKVPLMKMTPTEIAANFEQGESRAAAITFLNDFSAHILAVEAGGISTT